MAQRALTQPGAAAAPPRLFLSYSLARQQWVQMWAIQLVTNTREWWLTAMHCNPLARRRGLVAAPDGGVGHPPLELAAVLPNHKGNLLLLH